MLEKKKSNDLVFVLTTEADLEKAQILANSILESKFAACVSLRAINSSYWWKEKIVSSKEIEILMKTRSYLVDKLLNLINKMHSYDTPEFIYWDATSSPDYFEWLSKSIQKDNLNP